MPTSQYIDFRAVKAAVTMLQILEHYDLLPGLHRNGDSLIGACPIHGGDNETAFRVSLSKNCWNCFSRCACGGNVLDFVAKKERVSLLPAAHLLVEWFHLEIGPPPKNGELPPAKEKSPRVREKRAVQAADAPTDETPTGENKALEFTLKNLQPEHPYLTERGLSAEIVRTFGLGFCTKGLLKDRIAIPIHNAAGQLVAYAGRWPGPTDKEKYQFPKGFRKSLELFNLHRVLAETAEQPLVIVEGFFDCFALWQYGLRRVVALMGSHLSGAQEDLIRQHVNARSRVIVMLDEDTAGRAGREDVAHRLARFCFVKIHVFDVDGAQPDQLTANQARALIEGVA